EVMRRGQVLVVICRLITNCLCLLDVFCFYYAGNLRHLHSFPTRRSSDLTWFSPSHWHRRVGRVRGRRLSTARCPERAWHWEGWYRVARCEHECPPAT